MFEIDDERSLVEAHLEKTRRSLAKDSEDSVMTFLTKTEQQLDQSGEIVLDSIVDTITLKARQPLVLDTAPKASENMFSLSSAKAGITSVLNVTLPS